MADMVNHPAHYTKGGIEVIDFLEAWNLPLHEASIIQYVVRWRDKGGVEDLRKAKWYLERLINNETKRIAAVNAEVEADITYWMRESNGPTGEGTVNDEYRQLSPEEEVEYIQSLNQLHLDPLTEWAQDMGAPAYENDDDDDWSPENCARPITLTGSPICDDPCAFGQEDACVSCVNWPESNVTPYPPGHPYQPDGCANPCGGQNKECYHRGR